MTIGSANVVHVQENEGASSMLNNKPSVFLVAENHLLRQALLPGF